MALTFDSVPWWCSQSIKWICSPCTGWLCTRTWSTVSVTKPEHIKSIHCSCWGHYQQQYRLQYITEKSKTETYPCKTPLVWAICAAAAATLGFHLFTSSFRAPWSFTSPIIWANDLPGISFMTTFPVLGSEWTCWPTAVRPLTSWSFSFPLLYCLTTWPGLALPSQWSEFYASAIIFSGNSRGGLPRRCTVDFAWDVGLNCLPSVPTLLPTWTSVRRSSVMYSDPSGAAYAVDKALMDASETAKRRREKRLVLASMMMLLAVDKDL